MFTHQTVSSMNNISTDATNSKNTTPSNKLVRNMFNLTSYLSCLVDLLS